jgi:hypothetical protein
MKGIRAIESIDRPARGRGRRARAATTPYRLLPRRTRVETADRERDCLATPHRDSPPKDGKSSRFSEFSPISRARLAGIAPQVARSLLFRTAHGPGQLFERRLVMFNKMTNRIRGSVVAIALALLSASSFVVPASAANSVSVTVSSSSRYAYSAGYRVGYREGFSDGREDARRDRRFDRRKRSFSRGHDSIFREGFENGYERGYTIGFRSIRRDWDRDDWRDRRDNWRDRRDDDDDRGRGRRGHDRN